MNTKEKFYHKIQEATMSQLRDRLMPDRTNDAYKMAKKNIDSKLEIDNIQKDPKLALGYDTLKDKDTGILNIGREERKGTWGSFDPSKKSISVNKKDAQYPNKPISDERFKATTTHEIGHAASERLNPLNKKNGKYYYGNMPLKYDSQNSNTGTEELRQRRSDLTYRTGKPREDSLKWTTALHDRDQQALDKINDTDRNKARQILYKKYGAADRSTMTDRDLGKTATGTIIPEEIKMDIKENFYSKLQTIREEAEQLDELSDVKKAEYAMKAAGQITDYVAKGTKYDMSPEGESKTKGLMKRIGGLQRLDRMEKKKRKIRAIDKSRSKKRK